MNNEIECLLEYIIYQIGKDDTSVAFESLMKTNCKKHHFTITLRFLKFGIIRLCDKFELFKRTIFIAFRSVLQNKDNILIVNLDVKRCKILMRINFICEGVLSFLSVQKVFVHLPYRNMRKYHSEYSSLQQL